MHRVRRNKNRQTARGARTEASDRSTLQPKHRNTDSLPLLCSHSSLYAGVKLSLHPSIAPPLLAPRPRARYFFLGDVDGLLDPNLMLQPFIFPFTQVSNPGLNPPTPPHLARQAKATYVFVVITLDKNRAVGGVLLALLAERHRLTETMSVLRRAHGKALGSSWQELGASETEDTALYDAWLEHRGLAAALEAVESEINGIRHGDFSLA